MFLDSLPLNSLPLNSLPSVCGIHSLDNHPYLTDDEKPLAFIHNVCNIMDWIPGISIISGLARVIFAALLFNFAEFKDDDQILRPILKAEIFRGVISTIGLGILFAPADLYYSFNPPADADLVASSLEAMDELNP